MRKKWLVMVTLLSMACTTLVGCGETKVVEDVATEATESTDVQDASAEDPFKEKVVIDMNVIDTEKQLNDARYDYLEEKFNVEFKLVACSLNDVREKTRLWVATGDMPSVVWTDTDNVSELKSWAESGALKEITNLADYPNLQAIQDTIQSDDTYMLDGKRYFIPTARDLEKVNFRATQLMIYRKDWAEKLGMYQDEYTWDEMMELAKAMVEQDPGANGAGKTIGMASVGWAYPKCSGVIQCQPYWDTFYEKDGEYVWGPEQPEMIEGLKVSKSMIDENIMWSEQALAQTADGPAKFSAGQVGILYHNLTSGNIGQIISGLREAYPGEDPMDKIEIMKVKAPGADGYFAEGVGDIWGTICISASASDEVSDRLLAIMDFLASEEGIRLQRYGIEGVDYNMNGDEIEILWEKDELGKFVCPYEVNSDRILSLVMLNEFEKGFTDLESKEVQEINRQIVEYLQSAKVVREVDYDYNAFNAPNKNSSTLSTDVNSKITELLMTSTDIEADYKAWLVDQQDKKNSVLDELKTMP